MFVNVLSFKFFGVIYGLDVNFFVWVLMILNSFFWGIVIIVGLSLIVVLFFICCFLFLVVWILMVVCFVLVVFGWFGFLIV